MWVCCTSRISPVLTNTSLYRPKADADTPARAKPCSRPCLYCGRTFADKDTLLKHESAEAIEFEREASRFEEARRGRVTQSDFDPPRRHSFTQVIEDRRELKS